MTASAKGVLVSEVMVRIHIGSSWKAREQLQLLCSFPLSVLKGSFPVSSYLSIDYSSSFVSNIVTPEGPTSMSLVSLGGTDASYGGTPKSLTSMSLVTLGGTDSSNKRTPEGPTSMSLVSLGGTDASCRGTPKGATSMSLVLLGGADASNGGKARSPTYISLVSLGEKAILDSSSRAPLSRCGGKGAGQGADEESVY